jgi:recombinational DNA repair ATPase RecF
MEATSINRFFFGGNVIGKTSALRATYLVLVRKIVSFRMKETSRACRLSPCILSRQKAILEGLNNVVLLGVR